jgi:hypothetical protein
MHHSNHGPVIRAVRRLVECSIVGEEEMRDKTLVVLALALLTGLLSPASSPAGVNINVNVGPPPPPPVVFAEPPRLVVVPGSPVYYAPEVGYNVFVFRDHYYSFHDGAWFYAPTHRGPWSFVKAERVPRAVKAVPVKYYKIPPGHAKKMAGEHCPPGQAKHGRC